MATNLYRVRNGLSFKPQSSVGTPGNGDWYYDSASNTFRLQQGGVGALPFGDAHPLTDLTSPYTELAVTVAAGTKSLGVDLQNPVMVKNTWVATGTPNVARSGTGHAGSQNSCINFAGTGASNNYATTELFNGSAWTVSANSANYSVYSPGFAGNYNAGLKWGGIQVSSVFSGSEKWNGSAWATTNTYTSGIQGPQGCGAQNAALSAGGGTTPSGGITTTTDVFDGLSWSSLTNGLNNGRNLGSAVGTRFSALVFGGTSNNAFTGIWSSVESFNGSAFALVASLPTPVFEQGGAGTGAAALCVGGLNLSNSAVATVQKYNGNSWFNTTSLPATDFANEGTGGSQNLAITCKGSSAGAAQKFFGELPVSVSMLFKGSTSEFLESKRNAIAATAGGYLAIDIGLSPLSGLSDQENNDLRALGLVDYGDGSWSAGGNLNTARYSLAAAGFQNSALSFGGFVATYVNNSESYNGSTWTNTSGLNTARYGLAGAGILNAALSAGGAQGAVVATSELFNGSAWAATGPLNTARYLLAATGVQASALSFGGDSASVLATTESFNGSAWSNVANSMVNVTENVAGVGPKNAAFAIGGDGGSTPYTVTEKFNGTSWSLAQGMVVPKIAPAVSGTMNGATEFSGNSGTVGSPSNSAVSEKFNGLYWVTTGTLTTARRAAAGTGSQNSGLCFGGFGGSNLASTEKFATQVTTPVAGYIFGRSST